MVDGLEQPRRWSVRLDQLEAEAGPVVNQAAILQGFLAYMRATEEVLAIVAPGRIQKGLNSSGIAYGLTR